MERFRKQEQEPASDEVTEVAPGILRLQLPIRFDGLGHVNTYALLDDKGAAIVDPGMPGPGAWKSLRSRLRSAGITLGAVHTVVVTHSHPDHFGASGRLAKEAGATLVTHRAFMTWSTPEDGHCADDADDSDTVGGNSAEVNNHADDHPEASHPLPSGRAGPRRRPGPPQTTPWGTRGPRPPRRQLLLFWAMNAGIVRSFVPPLPTRRVQDGEIMSLGGREWLCTHTPGHTRDHLCLYDPAGRVLLSGDHVLPTITPHVAGIDGGADPLSDFLDSLGKVASVGEVDQVLPAHGHPFTDLPERVEAIKKHHVERLSALRRASAQLGPATVVELSHQLFRPARWGAMAESETYAHLEHLRLAGLAERSVQHGELLYELEPLPASSTPA